MIAVISFAAAVILIAVVLRIYTQREHARQTYEEMQQQNSEKRQTDTQESKEQSKTKEKKKKLDIPVDLRPYRRKIRTFMRGSRYRERISTIRLYRTARIIRTI